MINKIEVNNLTVFEKIDVEVCSGINIFIGENGTGKTHLLKMIYGIVTDDEIRCFALKFFRIPFENLLRTKEKIPVNFFDKGIAGYCKVFYDDAKKSVYEIHSHKADFKEKGGICYDKKPETLIINGDPINAVFIPAKEMLTHSRLEKDYVERDLPFDTTLIDILNKAGVSTVRKIPDEMRAVLDEIEAVIGGRVVYKNDRYFIEKQKKLSVEFSVEAEGFKKLGLIYRLIETGYLKKGSILIWDEPESNINPKLIPKLVDVLLILEKSGVQMFFATHDYIFAKYVEIKKNNENQIMFHSLYLDDNKGVLVESNTRFSNLKKNAISDAYNQLLDEVFEDTKRGGIKQ